jgi:hypothetical protein
MKGMIGLIAVYCQRPVASAYFSTATATKTAKNSIRLTPRTDSNLNLGKGLILLTTKTEHTISKVSTTSPMDATIIENSDSADPR